MNSGIEFFEARLRWQMDPSDLAAERSAGNRSRLVVDVRDELSWRQGHIPGALHVPRAQLTDRLPEHVDRDTPVVVYCWGPGCNGSTKAALELLRLGYLDVRELIGGFEYWAREGLAIESEAGRSRREVDELTAVRRSPRGTRG